MARQSLQLKPLVLEGHSVRLEPIAETHFDRLCTLGAETGIWTWYPASFATPGAMRRHVDEALAWQQVGTALCFVQVDRGSGDVAGCTRLVVTAAEHFRAEIGWTWLHPRFQRTALNTEAKYLLLKHAFETLELLRVEFKTDALNTASRRAIARIGAVEEGTLRSHMLTASGRVRDSVYFSVTNTEWPAVRDRLEGMISASSANPA